MLQKLKHAIATQQLTVLVTHWWEYFRERVPDDRFIQVLHELAAWLAEDPEILVISFDDIAAGTLPKRVVR